MTCRIFPKIFPASVIVFACAFCPALFAQELLPDAPVPAVAPVSTAVIAPTNLSNQHKFWDAENFALFGGAAASNGADFAVTRANLQSGGQELNPIVRVFGRSNAGLAVNFAGETAGVMGLSYFCHRTGHHKLERMVSVVNMGASVGAVSYGLTHRDATTNNVGTRLARQAGPFAISIKITSK
jgi:hypothetical protein